MKKKREDGMALCWVLAVMMFCFLLVSSALFLASAYHTRVLAKTKSQQAFLTARSLAGAVAAEFLNPPERVGSQEVKKTILAALEEQIEKDSYSETIKLMPAALTGLDSQMGECAIHISYDKRTREMEILAEAVVENQTERVCVHLKNEMPGLIEGGYYGIKTERLKAFHLVSAIQNGTDVWVTGEGKLDIAANSAEVSGGNPGKIYSHGDVIQTASLIGDGNPVLGGVISEGDILLTQPGNRFVINAAHSPYTLYSYCKDTGKNGNIKLKGAVKTDHEADFPGSIIGDRIELAGPEMEINSVVAGYTGVFASNGVRFTNDIYSCKRIELKAGEHGIQIGSEQTPVHIWGSDVYISGSLAGNQEDGAITRIYADITADAIDPEDGSITIDANDPVEIYGDVTYSNDLWISDNVMIYGEVKAISPGTFEKSWIMEDGMPPKKEVKLSHILNAIPQVMDSDSQELWLDREYDFIYRLADGSGIKSIYPQGAASSYLVVSDTLRLNLFDGNNGVKTHSDNIILLGGSLIMEHKSDAPLLKGNVYGKGRLLLEEGTYMEGICNPGTLILEKDVTVTVSGEISQTETAFSDNWTLVGYGGGNHFEEDE